MANTHTTYPDIVELNADEMQLLTECLYEEPCHVSGEEKRVAQKLIARGLLERNPSTLRQHFQVRRTAAGDAAATPLSASRVKYERDRIEELWREGNNSPLRSAKRRAHSLARERERVLWMRILVEYALAGSRNANIALETYDILK